MSRLVRHSALSIAITAGLAIAAGAVRVDPVAAVTASPVGASDTELVRGMIAHHQGAIHLAQGVIDHGHDPVLIAAAEDTIAAQKAEIASLQDWLAEGPAH